MELKSAMQENNPGHVQEEFGDYLFALVNFARAKGFCPEDALRMANAKFIRRFRYVENQLRKQGRDVTQATLEDMDALWEDKKRQERASKKK